MRPQEQLWKFGVRNSRLDNLKQRVFRKVKTALYMKLTLVTSFAKKTGDYEMLSVADIHILALTYELECELNHGDWRLHKEPGSVFSHVLSGDVNSRKNEGDNLRQSHLASPLSRTRFRFRKIRMTMMIRDQLFRISQRRLLPRPSQPVLSSITLSKR